jgi:hypothetical protein
MTLYPNSTLRNFYCAVYLFVLFMWPHLFVIRQQVGNGAPNELHLYIMPCGGAVDMELTLKGEAIVSRKQIYGYEMFRVMNPVLGQRYLLRISASKSEELHRISTVEVSAVQILSPSRRLGCAQSKAC